MNKNNKTSNNFKKAVSELLGHQTDDMPESEAHETFEPQFFDLSDEAGYSANEKQAETAPQSDSFYSQPSAAETGAQQSMGAPAAVVSVIAPDMAIMGNLSSNTDVNVCGRIIGNVVCGGSVIVGGDVEGDISASEIEIYGSVSGNISVSGKITIGNGAHVKGNMVAHDIYTSGLSEGDIKVEGRALFQSTAIIDGNVYAKTFEMNGGAKIKGLVKTYN